MANDLSLLLDPRAVAVIGAAPEEHRVGYALMRNLLNGGKREIYPVNEKYQEVLGVPCVPSVHALPANVDLAVIAVRADLVPRTLMGCGEKQIPFAIIISAGFKEVGDEGKKLEDEVRRVALEKGITILGPNCLGVINATADFNASFTVKKPIVGNISFISQSGAIGTSLLDWAHEQGVGFSNFVSLGNEAGISEIDMMEYLADEPTTHSVLMYLEKVSDGEKFIAAAKKVTQKKPLIILRAGRSQRGGAAVRSHTGSLAPNDAIFAAACKQAGAITVDTLRDLFTFAKLLHIGIAHPVQRLVVLTNGGGPSVNAADLIDLSRSLGLTVFRDDTIHALRTVLPSMAAVANPIDVIGDATSARYVDALKIISTLHDVDAIIVIVTPQMMTDAAAIAEEIVKFKDIKPIIPVFMGGEAVLAGIKVLNAHGLVNFDIPSDAIQSIDELAFGAQKIQEPDIPHPSVTEEIHLTLADFYTTQSLLAHYGIPICGYLMTHGKDIPEAVRSIGAEEYALKMISSSLVHKSDVGAVRTRLIGVGAIEQAWGEMYTTVQEKIPGITLEGMLLQPMVKGKEVIVGMKRDPVFGPVIIFGLGGIFVELLKDVSMRIAPVEKSEALAQIHEIKNSQYLQGMRGEDAVNLDAIADVIVALSRLALEHPNIEEIDLNPVMVSKNGAVVVDARLMKCAQ